MIYLTMPLNGLLMIAMPIVLAIVLHRRLGARGSLFGAGAITFVASQVVHLPLNYALAQAGILPARPEGALLIQMAVVAGLTSGLCEEIARWVAYRRFLKTTRSWNEALMFGAGHGGIEAIILGVLVLVTFAAMYTYQTSGVGSLPAEQQELARKQLEVYWSTPPFAALLGAVERVFALCTHLALSALVLQAFTRRNILFLFAAIGWHATVNGIALIALVLWGPYVTEAIIGVAALAAVAVTVALRNGSQASMERR